jgi:1-aminocyclopropane-1-carboxylate deaminase/D-cysteine desulfhydrase-like pyridoxal-dependent ACC family enzyme
MSTSRVAAAQELIDQVPRARLVVQVTPLQPMPRLSARAGDAELWIKRDDLTGLALGGNKVRQMEFFAGEALASGADVFIGGGSFPQSNHARVCAAAARLVGMEPVILVRPGGPDVSTPTSGNAQLTRLLSDDVRIAPALAEVPANRLAEVAARRRVFDEVADEYRARGHQPYCLYGSSSPVGVLGYVAAALEMQDQFDQAGLEPDWVVVTSMGATQAGLELGARLIGATWRVMGMAYQSAGGTVPGIVASLATEAARLLGSDITIDEQDVMSDDQSAGPSYGVSSDASLEAIRATAATEAIILDPVYSGKGMAGLLARLGRGDFGAGQKIVFIHTGGQPALFAYDR